MSRPSARVRVWAELRAIDIGIGEGAVSSDEVLGDGVVEAAVEQLVHVRKELRQNARHSSPRRAQIHPVLKFRFTFGAHEYVVRWVA